MTRENLLSSLRKFEEAPDIEISTTEVKNTPEHPQTIENDLNRTDFRFSKFHKHILINKLYLYILSIIFMSLPIPYFQGMLEVATVILDAYFQDKAASFRSKHRDIDGELQGHVQLGSLSESEKLLFEEFLKANRQTFNRFQKAIISVLKEKFLVLTENRFKNYNKYNTIFVYMMKTYRNVNIEENYSIKYMNHTLTFFKRLSGNEDVAFKLFNLILNSDPSMIFCILAVLFDKANQFNGVNLIMDDAEASNMLIQEINEEKIKEILRASELFQKAEREMISGTTSKNAYFFGAAASFLAVAFIVYRYRSKDDKE